MDLYLASRCVHLEGEATYLRSVIDMIGREVGAPESAAPTQVLEAAQCLRERLARAKGYPTTPQGDTPPLRERGW